MSATEQREPAPAVAGSPGRAPPPLDRLLARLGVTVGQVCFGAFAVAVATGIALATVYEPTRPLESAEAIQGAVAYGFLIRAAHDLAAQLFLVTCLVHIADHLLARSYRALRAAVWWRLTWLAPVAVAVMFTGFVLRADADAASAHAIAVSIVRHIPGLGDGLASLLLGEPYGSLQPVFLHHAVTFTLLGWLLTADHARRVWCGWLVFAAVLAAVTAVALVYHPGPGAPPGAAVGALHGPWYFVGLQTLLRAIPAWLAGVVLPLAMVVALGSLGHAGGDRGRSIPPSGERVVRAAWLILFAVYLLASALIAIAGMAG